jgi:hypothetical protein
VAALVLAGQNSVPIAQAGVATALGTFARAAGGTLGSAAFGSLLAARAGDPAALTPQTLASALHDTFLASAGALLIGAFLVNLLRVPTVRAPAPHRQQTVGGPSPSQARAARERSVVDGQPGSGRWRGAEGDGRGPQFIPLVYWWDGFPLTTATFEGSRTLKNVRAQPKVRLRFRPPETFS